MRPRADYWKHVFGQLIVMNEREYDPPRSHRYWECRCTCGNWTTVRQDALATGNTRSCGCKRRRQLQDHTQQETLCTTP